MRDHLEMLGHDPDVANRWPRIGALLAALAPILYEAEHDMDWDLSADSAIADDAAFQDRVCHAILEAAMKSAADRLFPRDKWATIQAVQARAAAQGGMYD